jgi:outer membrane receptor for ferrienterochelin and colicins
MRYPSALVYAIIFSVVGSLSVFAQEETKDEPAVIVVTGAKAAQDIEETVEAVEVVTAEEIQEMGAKNVKEVMENIPGVIIYNHPVSTLMMQGFAPEYVKILVNGIEIAGDVGGATPIAQLPASEIERIEIVRGASSVLYGSDAMGGVINIITKKAEKEKISASVAQEIASNLRYYGEGAVSYAHDLFALSVMGSFDYDDGKSVDEENNLGREISIYEVPYACLGSVRGSATWFHPGGELELYGAWSDSSRESSTNLEGGVSYDDTKREGGLRERYTFSDFLSLEGFVSVKSYDHHVDQLNYTYDTTSEEKSLFDDIESEVTVSWEPSISHSLLVGVNGKRESMDGDAFDEQKSTSQMSVFTQDTWNIGGADRFRIVPGLRFDYSVPEDSGDDPIYKLTPKLSFRYDPSETLVLRLAYGMGFKTPSLKQKYWRFFHPSPENFMLLGNPDLKPETSHGFNASVEYAVNPKISLTVGGYFNYVFDLIDTQIVDENSGTYTDTDGTVHNYIYTRKYRNVGKAITSGGDFSLRFSGSRLASSLAYNFTVAKEYDEDSDEYIDLPSRVPHQIKGSISYTIPHIETKASLQVNWNAPELIDVDEDTYTPDYLMVNAHFSKLFWKDRLNLYCGLRNALHNIHFIDSSDGESQEDYFGLRDGLVFYLGSRFTM